MNDSFKIMSKDFFFTNEMNKDEMPEIVILAVIYVYSDT